MKVGWNPLIRILVPSLLSLLGLNPEYLLMLNLQGEEEFAGNSILF